MKFANTVQHLSNREVLTHFLSLKNDNDNLKTLIDSHKKRQESRLKQKYPLPGEETEYDDDDVDDDYRVFAKEPVISKEQEERERTAERRGISDELVWVSNNVIGYLCSDLCPTARQTDNTVSSLADSLQDYGLVKSEVLQIINLAPVHAAELHCIIEEPETRFLENTHPTFEAILNTVASLHLPQPPSELLPYVTTRDSAHGGEGGDHEASYAEDEDEEDMMGGQEDEFVHEALWGADKEEGVGEEAEDPLDS